VELAFLLFLGLPRIGLKSLVDHFDATAGFLALSALEAAVDHILLFFLVLGLFLGVHLLDLTHLCLFIEVLVCNNLRLSFDLLHGFDKSFLLSSFGLLNLLAGSRVVCLDFLLLNSDLLFCGLVSAEVALLLILHKPCGQIFTALVERIPIESCVQQLRAILLAQHFLCKDAGLRNLRAVQGCIVTTSSDFFSWHLLESRAAEEVLGCVVFFSILGSTLAQGLFLLFGRLSFLCSDIFT